MKILVDIDNVAVDFVTAMIAYLNVRYDKQYQASDVVVWDFVESPNIDLTEKQFYDALGEFIELGLWDKSPVYPDAAEVLNFLFEEHCLIYLSSRPASATRKTISHFTLNGLPFNDLVILSNEVKLAGCGNIAFSYGLNKGKIAKNWGADLVIEDRPSTIQSYIDEGIRVVRKVEPYNSGIEYTGDVQLLKSSPDLTGFKKIVDQLADGSW